MAILSEVVELLRRWDVWKRVEEAPGRIDDLEQRVKALEARLAKSPGEVCPYCGEHGMRLLEQGRIMGGGLGQHRNDTWKCEACGKTDTRFFHLAAASASKARR